MVAELLKAGADEAPVAIVEDGRGVARVRLAEVIPTQLKHEIGASIPASN